MSDTRFAPVDAPERETLREPAKRWRNRYRITDLGVTFNDEDEFEDRYYPPGEYLGRPWPSRDVAEEKAADLLRSEWIELPECFDPSGIVTLVETLADDGEAP